MPFDYQVHRIIKGGPDGDDRVQAYPYTRISSKEGTIFLRDGRFFGSGGTPIEVFDVPDWVLVSMKDMTVEGLKGLGFDDAFIHKVKGTQPAPKHVPPGKPAAKATS